MNVDKIYVLIYMKGYIMPKKVDNVLEIFIKKLSKLLGKRLKKIILYGSYARGDFNKNSDIDLMILTDFNNEELKKYRIRVREIACDIEDENDVIISPLLRNIDRYNERIDIIPFYMNVNKEGVILNG